MTDFLVACYRTIRRQEALLSEALEKDMEEEMELVSGKGSIVLTGCGDSYAVAQLGFWAMESIGKKAIAISPTETRRIRMDQDSLVIGVSASGRSLETVASLKDARSRGAVTAALTDAPKGPITDVADIVWLTRSGLNSYNSTPSATTTAAMTYLLRVVAAHPSSNATMANDLSALGSQSRQVMGFAENRGREIADIVIPPKPVYFISEGPNLVAAQLGMMKFNELSIVKGISAVREEFRHHYNLSIETGDHAVLVTDAQPDTEDLVYLDILSKLGMRTYHLWSHNELRIVTPLVQTIPNTIALQMAAYYTALRYRPEMESFKKPHAEAFKIY